MILHITSVQTFFNTYRLFVREKKKKYIVNALAVISRFMASLTSVMRRDSLIRQRRSVGLYREFISGIESPRRLASKGGSRK